MANAELMRAFMEPNSIALVGVTKQTGEDAFNILENLLNYGFPGRIYPVNPNVDQILGVKSYPSIRDVPADIDLAVIASPRPTVLNIVKECAEKRVKGIVIVAQGFSDGNEEGKTLEAEVVRSATEAGARIMGPNSLGTANSFYGLNTSFAPSKLDKVPIGIICQSGLFFPGPPRLVLAGKAIDLGNACDIDVSDSLEYFESDPDTKVIVMYLEGIERGRRFLEVAGRVSKKKPILALKSGTSAWGAKAAQSHTGSLAGKDEVYEAAFRQCGIIRARDIEELADLSKAFCYLPLIRGNRIGVISMSGAGGVISADACQRQGLELARLSPETMARVRQLFPSWLDISNPFDTWPAFQVSGYPYEEVFNRALGLMLADPEVDGVVFISGVFGRQESWDPSLPVLQAAAKFKDKPIACWLYGAHTEAIAEKLEESGTVVTFPSCERAVRALARLREYAEFRERSQ